MVSNRQRARAGADTVFRNGGRAFADWNFGRSWDTVLEDTKRIRYGFSDVMDSDESYPVDLRSDASGCHDPVRRNGQTACRHAPPGHSAPMKFCGRSRMPVRLPAPLFGRQLAGKQKTKPSVPPTAIASAGRRCGRGWPSTETCPGRRRSASAWPRSWQTRRLYGT